MKNLTVSKADLISKLKTIEGLTNEERANLIGLLREHKKYGLVWEDKPEDVEERLREQLPVLREVKDKAIVSDESDAPNHILIEGDNLEALTALSYTHEGKIDVIYIDPPYNTGNKDFVYNDSFVDTEDSYRHSKWLSFMNKRLKIAKRLLSDRGVIFISIDDNEVSNLKLLCDDIFWGCFLQKIIIESNPRGSQSSKYFANVHEYLLCYSKKQNPEVSFGLSKNEDKLSEYSSEDNMGKYRLLGLRQRGGAWRRSDRPLLYYPIYVNPINHSVSLEKNNDYTIEVIPQRPTGEDSRWTWGKDKLLKNRHLLQGVKVNEGTPKEKWDIYRKDYLLNENGEEKLAKVKSIWNEKEINYQNGGNEIKDIIGDGKFSYPKPLFLLSKVISCSSCDDSIILDFFAGSGTTLHATMQLNAEDGGHRQCILVTNNENNICEEVTYERNKRVIKGYTTPKGVEVAGLKANTLRYYKTDYISRDRTQKNMRALVAAATDLLCIKEDLYEEQKKFGRAKVNPRVMRYFSDGRKHMLVVYREEVVDMLVEEIKSLPPTPPKGRGDGKSEFPKLKIYIFSPGRYAFDDNFYEVRDKVQLVALPAAIYDAYMKVLPKRREQMLDEEKKEETQMPQDLFDEPEKGGEV